MVEIVIAALYRPSSPLADRVAGTRYFFKVINVPLSNFFKSFYIGSGNSETILKAPAFFLVSNYHHQAFATFVCSDLSVKIHMNRGFNVKRSLQDIPRDPVLPECNIVCAVAISSSYIVQKA